MLLNVHFDKINHKGTDSNTFIDDCAAVDRPRNALTRITMAFQSRRVDPISYITHRILHALLSLAGIAAMVHYIWCYAAAPSFGTRLKFARLNSNESESGKHFAVVDHLQRISLSPQLKKMVATIVDFGGDTVDQADTANLTTAILARINDLQSLNADVEALKREKNVHHEILEAARDAFMNAKNPAEKVETELKALQALKNAQSNTKTHSQDHSAKARIITQENALRDIKSRLQAGKKLNLDDLHFDFTSAAIATDAAGDEEIKSAEQLRDAEEHRASELKLSVESMKTGGDLEISAAKIAYFKDVLTQSANQDHGLHVAIRKAVDTEVVEFGKQLQQAQSSGKTLTDQERHVFHDALHELDKFNREKHKAAKALGRMSSMLQAATTPVSANESLGEQTYSSTRQVKNHGSRKL
eukprot:SAG31_NODE_1516_length_8036_cov_2.800680_11_plen_415_part_00